MQLFPLTALKPGEKGTLRQVTHVELQITLMNMGLSPGDAIEVANWGVGGDPLAIRVGANKLSLSRELATSMLIERARP